MKALIGCVAIIFALATVTSADAKGCIKGAVVGAVAGHYAGHHAILGAAGGCIVGRHEAKKRGLGVERENLRMISAEWRREHGLGVLVDKAVEYFKEHGEGYDGLVVASLRNPGEADSVHALGGKVVWADADARIRYDRIQAHKAERDRAEEDNKTFEQFQAEEAAEMTSSGDAATLNMAGVKQLSDITVLNEGNDIEAFKDAAEKALGLA